MVNAEMLDILKSTKPFTGPPSAVSSDNSMEKVQFQLESTLPELKDLHEKGLFAKASATPKSAIARSDSAE